MEWQDPRDRPVKIVFRRSSLAARVIILAALAVSIALLVTLGVMTVQAREKAQALKDQAAALEQQNAALEQHIDDLNTLEGIENIAKEELGLVDPDTIIFDPQGQE